MLIVTSASAGSVAYWERSAVHSAWLGKGAAALGLVGQVAPADLRDVLRGLRPGSKEALTARPGLRRRHGWDLVFAAPKSVSLLASSGADGSDLLTIAFRDAVRDALELLEQRAAWTYRAGALQPAAGVAAAAFLHVHSDAGQPHLHSHVVLANGAKRSEADHGGAGIRWGCLAGNELWKWKEGLGSAFHLGLRAHLAATGFRFDWDLQPGGAGEIRQVPEHFRRAASSRSLATRATSVTFGSLSAGATGTARARSRRDSQTTVRSGPSPSIQLDPALARDPNVLPLPPPPAAAVERALAQRGSSFIEPAVFAALAETMPAGMAVRQAQAWAQRWCEESPRGANGRWTSHLARTFDERVVAAVRGRRLAGGAAVSPAVATAELHALGISGQAAEVGTHLACSAEAVSVLPPGPWLAQAACIDAARAVWQAAGASVRLQTPSELSARRWLALTSLHSADFAGHDRAQRAHGARVLVVDAAHRLGPAELCRLIDLACASATKLVLVPGGTQPQAGPGLAHSLDQLVEGGFAACGLAPLAPEPSREPASPGIGASGIAVNGALTGRDALAHAVRSWSTAALRPGAGRVLMVAFGPAEVEALNSAGRELWLRSLAGPGSAPPEEVLLGRRAYAVGEEVIALRHTGTVPSATWGTVVAIDREVGSAVIDWRARGRPGLEQRRQTLTAKDAKNLGHGYATTPPYLRYLTREAPATTLVVLGDPLELGRLATAARSAWVTVAGPGVPAFGPPGLEARRRSGIAQLATGWPDARLLELAGPRPLDPAKRQRWAQVVARHGLERELGQPQARPRHLGQTDGINPLQALPAPRPTLGLGLR